MFLPTKSAGGCATAVRRITTKNRTWAAALLLAIVFSVSLTGQNEKSVLLIVNGTAREWPECGLRERLERSLSDRNGLELADPKRADEMVRKVEGRFDRQTLLTDGRAEKYRFIVWLEVIKQRLTVENGFSIPVLFSQKRVKASMEIEYHILDCTRGRSVSNDRITVNKTGPAALECLDFTDADPNLLLSYPEKKALFDCLEDETARKLLASFDDIARQR
jgi:hypothetical protein